MDILERTGEDYNRIIFGEDYIPKNVYIYQIRQRNNIINRCLSNRTFGYALDFGCGTGFHLKTLKEHSERVVGIDVSVGALKKAKQLVDCEYVACDAGNLPFKENVFDLIWIAGVLHHMPDTLDTVVGNVAHLLKQNGIILVDEPNRLNLFNYLTMKLSKVDPTGKERPLSLSKVENMLRENNLSIIESNLYELFSPIGVVLKNNFILKVCELMDKCLSKTFLRYLSWRWWILAKKSEA